MLSPSRNTYIVFFFQLKTCFNFSYTPRIVASQIHIKSCLSKVKKNGKHSIEQLVRGSPFYPRGAFFIII